MTTYTVFNANGPIASHLTIEDAGREILSYDGGSYEIRALGDGGFGLYGKSLNGPWTRWPEFSLEDEHAAAEADILARLVRRSSINWNVYATTDESFERDMLDLIANADEDDRETFEEMLADWRGQK